MAEPVALLVFGVIVAGTSTARVVDVFGGPVSGMSYLTPFGLAKTTSLPRDVIERAAERLVRAGLLVVWPTTAADSIVGWSTSLHWLPRRYPLVDTLGPRFLLLCPFLVISLSVRYGGAVARELVYAQAARLADQDALGAYGGYANR